MLDRYRLKGIWASILGDPQAVIVIPEIPNLSILTQLAVLFPDVVIVRRDDLLDTQPATPQIRLWVGRKKTPLGKKQLMQYRLEGYNAFLKEGSGVNHTEIVVIRFFEEVVRVGMYKHPLYRFRECSLRGFEEKVATTGSLTTVPIIEDLLWRDTNGHYSRDIVVEGVFQGTRQEFIAFLGIDYEKVLGKD